MACAEVVVVPVEVGTLVIAVCAGQVVGFADGVACIFGGVKTDGVFFAVPGKIVHDNCGTIFPALRINQSDVQAVPLQQRLDRLLILISLGRRHQILGVKGGKGAAGKKQAEP